MEVAESVFNLNTDVTIPEKPVDTTSADTGAGINANKRATVNQDCRKLSIANQYVRLESAAFDRRSDKQNHGENRTTNLLSEWHRRTIHEIESAGPDRTTFGSLDRQYLIG